MHGPDSGADGCFTNKDHADIIAAAPETARQRDMLLDALKRALNELDYAYQGAEHFAVVAKAAARAAIAKAEGDDDEKP